MRKFDEKIAKIVDEVSVTPPADLMSNIRKRRSPLYIGFNHIVVNKMRYAVSIAALAILSIFLYNDSETDSTKNVVENSVSDDKSKIEQSVINESKDDSPIVLNEENDHIQDGNNGMNEGVVIDNSNDEHSDRTFEKKDRSHSPNLVADNQKDNGEKGINPIKDKLNSPNVDLTIDMDLSNTVVKCREEFSLLENEKQPLDNPNKLEPFKKELFVPSQIPVSFIGWQITPWFDNMSISSDNQELANRIENATSQRFTYGMTLMAGIPLMKNVSLHAGIGLLNRTENFDYVEMSNVKVLKIDTVIGVVHVPGGPDITKVRYDSSYISDGNDKQVNVKNKLSYINIPLAISYQFQLSNKLSIEINPGVNFGILQGSTGVSYMNSVNEAVYSINNKKSSPYNTSLNIDLQLGVGVEYNMNKRLSLIVQPIMRKGMGSVVKSSAGFKQNYTSFGLTTGIRYQL